MTYVTPPIASFVTLWQHCNALHVINLLEVIDFESNKKATKLNLIINMRGKQKMTTTTTTTECVTNSDKKQNLIYMCGVDVCCCCCRICCCCHRQCAKCEVKAITNLTVDDKHRWLKLNYCYAFEINTSDMEAINIPINGPAHTVLHFSAATLLFRKNCCCINGAWSMLQLNNFIKQHEREMEREK